MTLHRTFSGLLLALVTLPSAFAACAQEGPPGYDTGAGEDGGTTLAPTDAGTADHVGSDSGGFGGIFGDSGDGAFVVDPMTDVNVVITADNAYEFGWGDDHSVGTFNLHDPATLAGEIFNCGAGPEAYTIPANEAPPSAYLYIVAWADYATSQGVLGQFKRVGGSTLYTGDANWEVCATGVPYVSPAAGPDQAAVNAQIPICNAGGTSTTTTSAGWVNAAGAITAGSVGALAVGEDNSAGGEMPLVCQPNDAGAPGIDTASHWMWYAPPGMADPFIYDYGGAENSTRMYLIFRLPAAALPSPVR